MKKCPFCAEEIQDEAIVCRFCGRDLPKASEGKSQDKLNGLPSAWKQGAKGSAVLSALYVLSRLFTPQYLPDLIGSLTIGLVATFLFWWLFCTFVVWLWRKTGGWSIVIIGGAILGGFIILNGISQGIFLSPPTPTPFPSRTPIPTARIIQTPTLPPLVSSCIWLSETPESSFGEEICVQGFVGEIIGNTVSSESTRILFRFPNSFLYLMDDFYIIDDEYYYPDLNIGDCVYATGLIRVNDQGVYFMSINGALQNCP